MYKENEMDRFWTAVYRLSPTDEGDNYIGYDCADGFVVRARNEIVARAIVSEFAGDEGKEFWLDEKLSECEKIENHGEEGLILKSFLAG
jgi:hypothetical protein